jgi:hypothetical protein
MDFLRFISKLIKSPMVYRPKSYACPLGGYVLLTFMFLTIPSLAAAEWNVTGVAGTVTRLQTNPLNFSFFHLGPESTTTPVIGVEGGRSIWKLRVDGTFLRTTTGETLVVVGPALQSSQTNKGRGLLLDGGAEWPISRVAGFQVLARGGYGTVWVHVPTTDLPIDDHRQFWTYGFVGIRNMGSRYIIRIDVRNAHFRREEIPETLGRFNVFALGGFGLRF